MGRNRRLNPRLVQTDPPVVVKGVTEARRLKAETDERLRRLADRGEDKQREQ